MPAPPPADRLRNAVPIVLGVLAFGLFDQLVQQGMRALRLPAVGPVPAMLLLLALLLTLAALRPAWADFLRRQAQPAADFLLRWMPLLFAPPLIALPLVPAPAPSELARVVVIVVAGFVVNLLLVVGLAGLAQRLGPHRAEPAVESPPPAQQPKWRTVAFWLAAALALALAAHLHDLSQHLVLPGLLAAAIGSFLLGLRLPARVRLLLHPLVTCALGTHAVLACSPWHTADFLTQQRGHPGPGDLLLGLLGPSVLALGLQVYDKRALLRRHLLQLVGVLGLCAPLSLLGTVAAARLLGLPRAWILALAPRSVTIPIAMPIAVQLHADMGRAASAIVVTGILGAVLGRALLDALRIRDPALRGLGIGAASHGVGTAALVAAEPLAAAVSGLSFALFAVWSAVAASVPGFGQLLQQMAGP